jgi:hypothetical protein
LESDPCGSVSIRATGQSPRASASTATWPDSVVLPDPPFCEANTMTAHLLILSPFPSLD